MSRTARFEDDGARQRDALLLSSRQLPRVAAPELLEADHRQGPLDALAQLGIADLALLEREADVLRRRHVREQRVVLEDHPDVPLVRRQRADGVAVHEDVAVGHVGEARDHVQRRRLARAARPEEGDELAGPDVERHPVDGRLAAVALDDVPQLEGAPAACSVDMFLLSARKRVEGQQAGGQHEDHRGSGRDGGVHLASDAREHLHGQRAHVGALDEQRHDDLVERRDEREQGARQTPGRIRAA
jgi:hypothetical protein